MDEFRRSDWDNIIAVDLTGSFDVAQRAIPLLRKAGGGRIVNIASVAAVHPLRLQVGFGAAKAGVVNMTQCMALELGGEGIFVNAIAPVSTAHTSLPAASLPSALHESGVCDHGGDWQPVGQVQGRR